MESEVQDVPYLDISTYKKRTYVSHFNIKLKKYKITKYDTNPNKMRWLEVM